MKILSCNSNINLAESISKALNTQLVKVDVKRFSDMEVFVEVQENVRGEAVSYTHLTLPTIYSV